jgi:putative membrane protein insertion efficiency factor
MTRLLLAAIWLYQKALSPYIGWHCRFTPTCSHYAQEALRKHGAWHGLRLTASRLWRCRPGGGFGQDDVP